MSVDSLHIAMALAFLYPLPKIEWLDRAAMASPANTTVHNALKICQVALSRVHDAVRTSATHPGPGVISRNYPCGTCFGVPAHNSACIACRRRDYYHHTITHPSMFTAYRQNQFGKISRFCFSVFDAGSQYLGVHGRSDLDNTSTSCRSACSHYQVQPMGPTPRRTRETQGCCEYPEQAGASFGLPLYHTTNQQIIQGDRGSRIPQNHYN